MDNGRPLLSTITEGAVSDEFAYRTIGKYELRERIGRGGMAEVYKAYHAALDRFVAIKILHPFLGDDPEFKQRFEREARNVAQLRHPNIVQVYDFDHDAQRDLYYMVMEYINGPTLRTHLIRRESEENPLTINESIYIVRSLAQALAYAHSRGMVHRDIKPTNVMLDAEGRVVLTDFGIARIISGPNMTASGTMVGTPTYMSPELGLGRPGDHRADIYSLGILFYQLLTGSPPFDADTPIAIVLKHVNEPLPSPSDLNPAIPSGIERILYKALAKSPEERYQNIEDMVAHLDNFEAAELIEVLPDTAMESGSNARSELAISPASPAATESLSRALPLRQPRSCLSGIIVGLVAVVATFGGVYASFANLLPAYFPFIPSTTLILTATPTATMTAQLTPSWSLTNDTAAHIEEFGLSQLEALATQTPTPPDIPSVDQTDTALDCAYTYEVASMVPESGSQYPELTTMTLSITFVNTGKCPLNDDTRLVFIDGFHLDGPNYVEFNQQVMPGEQLEMALKLRTPAYNPDNPVVRSQWAILLPNGLQVGQPLIYEVTLLPGATLHN